MNTDILITQFIEVFQQSLKIVKCEVGECNKGVNGILLYLYKFHDGASAGELKEYFHIGSGGIANALKELEEKGLVVRRNSESDKRIVSVYITDKGKLVAEEVNQLLTAKLRILFESIGEDDTKALIRVVSKLIELEKNGVMSIKEAQEC